MPELGFEVVGVDAVGHGMAPLLHFKLQVSNAPADEVLHGLLLQAQIQVQPVQRSYSGTEQEKLIELFGPPERWSQTLRNRLWAHSNATLSGFQGTAEVTLPVPCSYDLNLLATRYAYALEDGEIPLLFLFSGSVFYMGPGGRLQVQRISWDKECRYRMPVKVWREAMNQHFPNTAWLALRNDVFERLYAYRRRAGTGTWEATIDKLLGDVQRSGGIPHGPGIRLAAQDHERALAGTEVAI